MNGLPRGYHEKVDRSAFLYFDPQNPKEQFAQCGTCFLFDPEKERCAIHGPDVKIDADDSCGLYVHGKPSKQSELIVRVTPDESGLVDRQVRCQNCHFFQPPDSTCDLYEDLNEKVAKHFKLNTKVNKFGCCNAQTPK